jgi:2-keto-4-pentenoate hydratase/2-oxohepta-3-ene-1,7-dioic acid hydratase in catechol pathway
MKLCTFEIQTQAGRLQRLGAVVDDGIVDLNFAFERKLQVDGNPQPARLALTRVPANMLEFLEAGDRAMEDACGAISFVTETGERLGANGQTLLHARDAVKLLTPLPNPRSLRDFYGFEEHVKRGFERRGEPMPVEWYEIPVYYKTAHHNLIGTEEDVRWPSFTDRFDYELELLAVIGRKGRDVSAANASQHIAGFAIMNDFSARDIQRREMKVRLGPAKGKDWCTAIGPWLVTRDEIPDVYALNMEARINGEVWSEGNSNSLYWKFEQMIEFLTEDDVIVPGDLIGSGTVGGGCGLELDRWVERGDVMELEIEKIGTLRNRVV